MSKHAPQIFFSVGEPSGDQHTARLIRALAADNRAWRFRGFGGENMAAADCRLDFELTQLAVMGIVEVLPKLREFFRVADQASLIFARQKPDAVVLADFPGFNWHIAKRAKQAGIPVYYYLPPQLWAWAPWRIRKVRKYVDHVLSVLPFEHQWYLDQGVNSTFVGHPFFDAVAESTLDTQALQRLHSEARGPSESRGDDQKLVGVLPGSRTQEVQRNWPSMLAAIRELSVRFPKARFAVAAFRDAHCLWCRDQMTPDDHRLPIDFYVGKTSEIIAAAHCAMMVSGSVSLELMARGTPAAVLYQTGRMMYATGKAMVRVPSITLPNLIAQETVFPELALPIDVPKGTQFLIDAISPWLGDPDAYHRVTNRLADLREQYAKPGASQAAAATIRQLLRLEAAPGTAERAA